MDDVDFAAELLSEDLGLSREAAEELTMILHLTAVAPENSILDPENGDFWCDVTDKSRPGRTYMVLKAGYLHSFVFLVRHTPKGEREVVDIVKVNRKVR